MDRALPSTTIVRRSRSRIAYCDASLPADLRNQLWNEPSSLIRLGEPLRNVGQRWTARLNWGGEQFVLKYYGELSRLHRWKRLVQRSRAWSTWQKGHRLIGAGIDTPRPVACIENRWGPLRRDSFLLYRYVEGQTLRSHFQPSASPRDMERLWSQLRELWRRLRRARASLTDTNTGNFIVCPAGRLWAIDLDSTRFHHSALLTELYLTRAWSRLGRSVATAQRGGKRLPAVGLFRRRAA